MTDAGPSNMESRFVGALLGTMVGDRLGAVFEGTPPETVADLWTSSGRNGADWIAANYEPYRGYGSGSHHVLSALKQGVPWNEAATLVLPDGSFGNGAAMRVAPVGLYYHEDLDKLRDAAQHSASITHTHPWGMEGAVLQALAVATAVQASGTKLDPGTFLGQLREYVRDDSGEYAKSLKRMANLLTSAPPVSEIVTALGHDVWAHRSVPAAIYAFLSHPDAFVEAVEFAVMLGGDTDTIGAMTGAIAGAYHGLGGIPMVWRDALENTVKGRDYVEALANKLCQRYAEQRRPRE